MINFAMYKKTRRRVFVIAAFFQGNLCLQNIAV